MMRRRRFESALSELGSIRHAPGSICVSRMVFEVPPNRYFRRDPEATAARGRVRSPNQQIAPHRQTMTASPERNVIGNVAKRLWNERDCQGVCNGLNGVARSGFQFADLLQSRFNPRSISLLLGDGIFDRLEGRAERVVQELGG
jgi:hypothetical protein